MPKYLKPLAPTARCSKPANAKWNWTLFEALYFAGATQAEILQQPEFKGLSAEYARKTISINGWAEMRAKVRKEIVPRNIMASVAEALATGREAHLRFMDTTLEKERAALEKRPVTMFGQEERLDLLTKYDALARKTYGCDEKHNSNPVQQSLSIMLTIGADAKAKIRGISPQSATNPQVIDVEATTGNAEAANRHPEANGEQDSDFGGDNAKTMPGESKEELSVPIATQQDVVAMILQRHREKQQA